MTDQKQQQQLHSNNNNMEKKINVDRFHINFSRGGTCKCHPLVEASGGQ